MTNQGNVRNQMKCHAIQKYGYDFHQDSAELLREIHLVVLSQQSLDHRLERNFERLYKASCCLQGRINYI